MDSAMDFLFHDLPKFVDLSTSNLVSLSVYFIANIPRMSDI